MSSSAGTRDGIERENKGLPLMRDVYGMTGKEALRHMFRTSGGTYFRFLDEMMTPEQQAEWGMVETDLHIFNPRCVCFHCAPQYNHYIREVTREGDIERTWEMVCLHGRKWYIAKKDGPFPNPLFPHVFDLHHSNAKAREDLARNVEWGRIFSMGCKRCNARASFHVRFPQPRSLLSTEETLDPDDEDEVFTCQ